MERHTTPSYVALFVLAVTGSACTLTIEVPQFSTVARDAAVGPDAVAMDVVREDAVRPDAMTALDTIGSDDAVVVSTDVGSDVSVDTTADGRTDVVLRDEFRPCARGMITCAGACVDPESDPNNCGSCGTACAVRSRCDQRVCCGPTQGNCDGNPLNACEVDFTTRSNCGSCGTVCPTVCVAGSDGYCNPTTLMCDCVR